MPRYMILRMEAPLMAFGDEIVDSYGRVRSFPGASNVTGLIANALGWTRGQRTAHQRLQGRLDLAVRLDRPGTRIPDFQTAQLGANDCGWTTRGLPEGRAGGEKSYRSPHIRHREMIADAALTLALALAPAEETPTLDDCAAALTRPARPLFCGRKPCLPAAPFQPIFVEAPDALAAANATPAETIDTRDDGDPQLVGAARADLPPTFERRFVADERNWISGVHGGGRMLAVGRASHLPGAK